jgi:hypothetical protein
MFRTRLARFLPLALLLILSPGCGGSSASISGAVTYNGEPVGDGSITFIPVDGKGPSVGSPIEGGHYLLDSISPGPKLVRIEAYKKVHFAQSSEEMAKKAAAANKYFGDGSGLIEPADVIPPNADGNNTKMTIEPGQQTHDFHLKKLGGPKGR